MHATAIWPILGTIDQFGPHWILADILPFLRVIFAITQPVMKSSGLKSPNVRVASGKAILPKADPAFDGKFQIARRTKQMQVIRHQQIIAHEPCGGSVLPDVM